MADSPAETPKWSLKKKLLLLVALPLVVLLGALLLLDAMGGARLNTAMSEARTIGGPVTFDELMAARKVWPEAENGANVILKLKDRLEQLSKNDNQLISKNNNQLEPLPGFESKGHLALGRRLPPERDQASEELLARLAPELAEIDQLLQYSGGSFPITIGQNPIFTELPHLKLVRTSAKLKYAQAQYRAMHGDTSHAVDDCRIILVHARLTADEPFLLAALDHMACEALAVDTLQRVCALATLTPEQLERLQESLTAIESPDRLALGVRGERANFLGLVDLLRQKGLTAESLDDEDGDNLPAGWRGRTPGIRGILVRDEAIGLHLYNQLVAAAGDRRKAMQVTRQIAAEAQSAPAYATITHLMTHSMERTFELDGNFEAQLRSATAGLAAERYRLDHGRFPEKLEDLVPQYIRQVPLDPFNDQPLRSRHYDGALLIYSVGADLTDDGGSLTGWIEKGPAKDWGFILLPPKRRGLPATQPASKPADDTLTESPEHKAERLKRFREGPSRATQPAVQ